MYKYEEPVSFSEMHDLLNKYSQEDIFKIVFGEYPDYGDSYLSPFREDNNPNCFFEWYKGKLLFRDFADQRRDCFNAVKDYFHFNTYQETIAYIIHYFENNGVSVKPDSVPINSPKKFHQIVTLTRPYVLRDDLYWKQYHINEEQLTNDFVYPISRFRFYSTKRKRWITSTPLDITYSISGFTRAKKIYRPTANTFKWLTNCSANDVGNIENISKDVSYLIITKSYKDHRVIKNEGFNNTVWFQSESMMPNDKELMKLLSPFPDIFIFYDNDSAGIKGSSQLREKIMELFPSRNPIQIFSPYSYMKDPAELVSVRSKSILYDLLWENFYL